MDEQTNQTQPNQNQDKNTNLNDEMQNQLKRALADYANLQKRYEKEKEEVIKFSTELLLMQMINIIDGFEMTFNQMQKLLEKNGFTKKYANVGDKFDAAWMEAVESDGNGDLVVEVYAPAYNLHEKIIRPAKVKVGKENK